MLKLTGLRQKKYPSSPVLFILFNWLFQNYDWTISYSKEGFSQQSVPIVAILQVTIKSSIC